MVERGDYGQLTEVLEDPQLRATVQRFRYDGGHTLLHKCAILNMPRLADAALPADGSAQEWANESCDAHMTALHICALLDSSAANAALDAAAHFVPSVTRVLLHGGADPNICAKDGSDVRPLHVAAFHGAAATARELIAGGAEVNACDAPQMNTPLHYAAASDSVDVARVLLQSGATCCSNASGWTPLHVAAQWDAGEVAELLLHSVPRRRLTATVSLGADALGMAALFGSDRVLAVMLRHGYGLKRRAHGRTAVHIAAAAGNVTALRMLLDDARARAGSGGAASPEAGAAAGAGAVHSSDGLGADSEPTVPVGICDGTAEQANEAPAAGHWLLRLKDEASGNTVLHEAAAFGGPDVVRVVLNDYLYRDIYVVNEAGKTALDLATLAGDADSVHLIEDQAARLEEEEAAAIEKRRWTNRILALFRNSEAEGARTQAISSFARPSQERLRSPASSHEDVARSISGNQSMSRTPRMLSPSSALAGSELGSLVVKEGDIELEEEGEEEQLQRLGSDEQASSQPAAASAKSDGAKSSGTSPTKEGCCERMCAIV